MSDGCPSISRIKAIMAPTPNNKYAMGWWLMKPSTSAFMIDACGDASTGRKSPGSASPNWNVRASITIVNPAATAAAMTPRNFTFSCAEGVEPSQYPVLRSVIVWPDTDNAVHTIAAITITKNMPLVPDTPNLSKTAQEMMMVSIVIPETGLRAVVAMALAATDVKKKEKTSVSTSPIPTTRPRNRQSAQEHRYTDRTNHDSEKDGHH